AVQYAVAMGMRVVAVDVADDKLALAKKDGAEITVNAFAEEPADLIQDTSGGSHGALVTAVHPKAFGQAHAMTRRGGTIVFTGLTIRGSIAGTRQDMVEALEFYAAGKIHPTFTKRPLEDINQIFDEMVHGKIDGRVVIEY